MARSKAETASVMAEETRAKRELDECTEQINKMQSYAEKALTAGNEADARSHSLRRSSSLQQHRQHLQQAYNVAADNAAKMRQMHDKLVKDIDHHLRQEEQQLKLQLRPQKLKRELIKLAQA